MNFGIDKQTLDELNLLGKFRSGSVYNLFNQVKTRGGEQLLDKMFRSPMNDVREINERTDVFYFFQEKQLTFPVDAQQISLMREYMDSGAGSNLSMVFVSTLFKKLLSNLARDERYKKNIQGLQAVIAVMNRCYIFLQNMPAAPDIYRKRIAGIMKVLSDSRIEKLRKIDIYKSLSLTELVYFNHLLKSKLYTEIEDVMDFIYELDVNIHVSAVACRKGFTFARAFRPEENIFSAKDLRHPCVEKAVGNSLVLDEDSNVLFLTGANMAGKSTFMKSVGIGIYLAHIGFPVAAESMNFSVREGLYSSINVADNINLGYSHFYAEVVRVKQAAVEASSGKRLLLMFDELFKGTNVKDAYDGTLAVTEGFSEYKDCLFIVSTHIIEVGAALKSRDNIKFAYMPTVMEGSRPRYTYQMNEGITEDRQGMMIIRNEGILELIGD
ncbi:DNA mismatch repair protein [Pedobacter sp. MC2016-24]|uniref:MutS-related protein n=1 Tax=Pedobacter sp. MC2016-24 TaxID=2780090 RepID=UPI00187ED5CB|nr:DNA mismatch repair protein [Pedobacter sp. MC2016-24]MBE9601400.1 DNA mismatch repair protein [Pedobacter sp. MC2016-24]